MILDWNRVVLMWSSEGNFPAQRFWKVVSHDSNLQNILEFLALGEISLWQHPSPILGWRGRERTISLSWSPSLCRAHERPKLSYRRSLSSLSCIFPTNLYIPVIYDKVRYWTPSNLLFIHWTIYVVLMLLTLKEGYRNMVKTSMCRSFNRKLVKTSTWRSFIRNWIKTS